MNNTMYEAVRNYAYTERMALSKEQAETFCDFESFYRCHLSGLFEYIQEQVADGEVVELDSQDFKRLSFLKDDLESLFSVFGMKEE